AWKNGNSGQVMIWVNNPTNCKAGDLTIWIQERDFPYTRLPSRTVSCSDKAYYWDDTSSIYYRFRIDSASNTGGPFTTSGTVYYP
ncbi:MAG TPA: hypothetical protein VFE45_09915, partial [Coriobacteriia bacterium]|nr:hypothetical protein [Coriobacteriia bacterium]